MEEIRDELICGNFIEAEKKSRQWLASFSLADKNNINYKRAGEAYIYSQYLLNRQDSIGRLETDDQRARYFREVLNELNRIRVEKKFEKMDNPLWRGIDNYLHARIAENYARAFAGQKSFNLDQNEIIQFSISLLTLEKWQTAIEALDFLLRLNRHNAAVNFLMAFAFDKLNQKVKTHVHLRDALFYKPEVISEYTEFIPGEVFEKYWRSFVSEASSEKTLYREFALLLELNGVYKSDLEISTKELQDIEREFNDKFKIFELKNEKSGLEISELLHYLCWLIIKYQKNSSHDKVEFYRQKMIFLSPDAWETFNNKRVV
ncbi:MAG: hypothetical protein OEV78_00220 [Spirochaetia bacterium]|nr:hypothetical protein [Spirochaetia bacterium]